MNKPDNNNTNEIYTLLSLGSNLNDKKENLELAVKYLRISGALRDIKISSYYETEPVGYKNQGWFLNIAVEGYTTLPLYNLIQLCKSIEYLMGREVKERWASRIIDLDILLYGDKKLKEQNLTVPHPRMHERRFVLEPAAEIAGSQIHPEFGTSISTLLENCTDDSKVSAAVT